MTDIGVSDKAFNAIIMQMLQQAITNTLETNGKTENLSRDTEDMKKNQEKLELQTKILLDGLNIADQRRYIFKKMNLQQNNRFTQSEQQKEMI